MLNPWHQPQAAEEPSRLGAAAQCPQPVAFPKPVLVKGCQGVWALGRLGRLGRLGKFPFPAAAAGFGIRSCPGSRGPAGPLLTAALSIPLSGSRFEFGSKGRNMKGCLPSSGMTRTIPASEQPSPEQPGPDGSQGVTRVPRERHGGMGWDRRDRGDGDRNDRSDGMGKIGGMV